MKGFPDTVPLSVVRLRTGLSRRGLRLHLRRERVRTVGAMHYRRIPAHLLPRVLRDPIWRQQPEDWLSVSEMLARWPGVSERALRAALKEIPGRRCLPRGARGQPYRIYGARDALEVVEALRRPPGTWDRERMAREANVTLAGLGTWRRDGMPTVRRGRRTWYDPRAVAAWLLGQRRVLRRRRGERLARALGVIREELPAKDDPAPVPTPATGPWDRATLMREVSISPSGLERWRNEGMPTVQHARGHWHRYDPHAVAAWLRGQRSASRWQRGERLAARLKAGHPIPSARPARARKKAT